MREPLYKTDDEWRTAVIMNLAQLRRTIYELGVFIAALAVGAFATRLWPDGPIIIAAVVLIAALIAYRMAAKDYTKLANLHSAAEKD
jgi:hypothetical protein